MPETAYALYVGIDWGTVTHQVAVLDAQRLLRGERAIAHAAVALHALTEWLTQLARGEPARGAVALEVPRGAVGSCPKFRDLLTVRHFPGVRYFCDSGGMPFRYRSRSRAWSEARARSGP